MTTSHEEIFRRWIQEVLNEKRENTIDELFAADGILVCPHTTAEHPIRGIEGLKAFIRAIKEEFPSLKIIIEEILSEDHKVTAICRGKATVRDAENSEILHEVESSGLCVIKIADGKIKEFWHSLDFDNANNPFDDEVYEPL